MKISVYAVALIAGLLSPFQASAWFFFFIPGQAIDAIGDALTGSEGKNCVGPNAKVGDKIRLSSGSIGTIKSLSGTSSRCTSAEYPIRALLEVSSDTSAPIAPINTKAGINLPDGWEAKPVSDIAKADGGIFRAVNQTTDTGLLLSVRRREGISDMPTYVNARSAAQASRLKDAKQSDIAPIVINGLPAWRFHVTGTFNGRDYTYLQTIFDAGPEILLLNAWTTAPAFETQRPALEKLAEGITGFTPPTPAATAPTPVVPTNSNTPPSAPTSVESAAATTAPANPPATQTASTAQRIRELNALYKDGVIEQKEYEEQKKRLLDSI